MDIEKNSSFKVNTSSKNTIYSLYELLVEGSSLSLPILITLDNKTYNTSCIPENVLSSKLQLNELENSDMKIINKLEVKTLKKNIKNGFEIFLSNSKQSLYTKLYFIKNTSNQIINSDIFLKKLHTFLNNSILENKNPIIYINNLKITKMDFKKSINCFKTYINNIISNQNKPQNESENIEINKDIKASLFKRIDILSNLLNLDSEKNYLNSIDLNNSTNAIFKTINIA